MGIAAREDCLLIVPEPCSHEGTHLNKLWSTATIGRSKGSPRMFTPSRDCQTSTFSHKCVSTIRVRCPVQEILTHLGPDLCLGEYKNEDSRYLSCGKIRGSGMIPLRGRRQTRINGLRRNMTAEGISTKALPSLNSHIKVNFEQTLCTFFLSHSRTPRECLHLLKNSFGKVRYLWLSKNSPLFAQVLMSSACVRFLERESR